MDQRVGQGRLDVPGHSGKVQRRTTPTPGRAGAFASTWASAIRTVRRFYRTADFRFTR